MKTRRINAYLFIGLMGLFTSGSMLFTHLYQVFWGNEDIWWTLAQLRLTVEETRDRFQMTIGGKSLRKHLADGTLSAVELNGNPYRVVSRDVGVRVNNWDRVKGSILTGALFSSFGFGMSLAFLIVGLVQRVRERKG